MVTLQSFHYNFIVRHNNNKESKPLKLFYSFSGLCNELVAPAEQLNTCTVFLTPPTASSVGGVMSSTEETPPCQPSPCDWLNSWTPPPH